MDVTVARPGELTGADLSAWRAMQSADPALQNPFLSPEFARAAGRVRPSARVGVLRDGGHRPVGYFPFERRPLGLGTPIATGLCDCQGLIHAPGTRWDAAELLSGCGLRLWEFDHLTTGQTPFTGGEVRRAGSPVVDLSDGYEAYRDLLRARSKGFLRGLLGKERRLERRAGELRFVFDERDPEPLEALMRWKSAQYRERSRVDQFARPWVADLVRELHTTRAAGCTGLLSVLYAGGRPVAGHFGPCSRQVLCCWFPAYDAEFATCSPGMLLHLRMAEEAAARGIGHYDLGKGAERYKDDLKTGELPLLEGRVSSGTPSAALRRFQADAAHGLRRAVAGNTVLRGMALRTMAGAGRPLAGLARLRG
ncbi:GNAT family N-acetyltransferase [Streptomyces sp. NPDC048629]|uniref:GNAT family N-acetyltransferase n=1 Tax=Streptomyces sp. NPDC048629 TaxID=3154824 RepID=UPI0034361D7C